MYYLGGVLLGAVEVAKCTCWDLLSYFPPNHSIHRILSSSLHFILILYLLETISINHRKSSSTFLFFVIISNLFYIPNLTLNFWKENKISWIFLTTKKTIFSIFLHMLIFSILKLYIWMIKFHCFLKCFTIEYSLERKQFSFFLQ